MVIKIYGRTRWYSASKPHYQCPLGLSIFNNTYNFRFIDMTFRFPVHLVQAV